MIDIRVFYAIKHNAFPPKDKNKISEADVKEYEIFSKLVNDFVFKVEEQDNSSFSILSSIASMFGYNRRFCSMCGKPIIQEIKHIQNRMVCDICYDSYKITEQLYKIDKVVDEKHDCEAQNDA